jgi:hypothetical protein
MNLMRCTFFLLSTFLLPRFETINVFGYCRFYYIAFRVSSAITLRWPSRNACEDALVVCTKYKIHSSWKETVRRCFFGGKWLYFCSIMQEQFKRSSAVLWRSPLVPSTKWCLVIIICWICAWYWCWLCPGNLTRLISTVCRVLETHKKNEAANIIEEFLKIKNHRAKIIITIRGFITGELLCFFIISQKSLCWACTRRWWKRKNN